MDLPELLAILESPAWKNVPRGAEPIPWRQVWRRVSVACQTALRLWIYEKYFADLQRYEDRKTSYPIIVYAASRPCYGIGPELTYDVADRACLDCALRQIGSRLREILNPACERIVAAGRRDIAVDYNPHFHEDIRRAVLKQPGPLLDILAAESRTIMLLVAMGASPEQEASRAASRFLRHAASAARGILGRNEPPAAQLVSIATAILEGKAEAACS